MTLLLRMKQWHILLLMIITIEVPIFMISEASNTYPSPSPLADVDANIPVYCYEEVKYAIPSSPSTFKYQVNNFPYDCLTLPSLDRVKNWSRSYYFFQNESILENSFKPDYTLLIRLHAENPLSLRSSETITLSGNASFGNLRVDMDIIVENYHFKMYIPYWRNEEFICTTAYTQQQYDYNVVYLPNSTRSIFSIANATGYCMSSKHKNKIDNDDVAGNVFVQFHNKQNVSSSSRDAFLANASFFSFQQEHIHWLFAYVKDFAILDDCKKSVVEHGSFLNKNDIITCDSFEKENRFELLLTNSYETWLLIKESTECCNNVRISGQYPKSIWHFLANFLPDDYFCYGTSTFCRNVDYLWIIIRDSVSKSNQKNLVVMREDVIESLLVKWLSSFIKYGKFSISVTKCITSSECKCEYSRFALCICNACESDTDFKEFISMLKMKEVECIENKNYVLCRKLQVSEIPFLFLPNCSSANSTYNKLAHAVLDSISYFVLGTDNYEHGGFCKINTELAMTYELENVFLKDIDWPVVNASSVLKYLQHNGQDANWLERDYYSHKHHTLCEFFSDESRIRILFYECEHSQNKSTFVCKHDMEEKYDIISLPYDSFVPNNVNITKIMEHRSVKAQLKSFFADDETKLIDSVIKNNVVDTGGIKLTIFEYFRLIILSKLHNDSECLHELIENKFSIFVFNDTEKSYVALGPLEGSYFYNPCFKNHFQNQRYYTMGENLYGNLDSKHTTVNILWPTCLYDMVITFSRGSNIVVDWDYLSPVCKLKEYVLISMSVVITSITILGNMLVLLILLTSGLLYKKSFMIYASLALSDLILGLMSGALAVHDQFALTTGSLVLRDISDIHQYTDYRLVKSKQSKGFQQLRIEMSGYRMFCSMMMNISIYSSLLSLALFSIERFRVLMGNPFQRRQMLGGICFSWLLSIALSILVNMREDGLSLVGYFDPITKLTTNMGSDSSQVSSVAFYAGATIAGMASIIILVLTVAAIVLAQCKEKESQKTLRIHHFRRDWNISFMTRTFIYMVILFLTASIPLCVDLLLDLSTVSPAAHYICWWLFMAGASWNWVLYCFRGQLFREHARKIFYSNPNNVQTTRI